MGNRLLSLCSLVVALFIGSTASALTITFDELPVGTVVDGMVIGNVTFGFSSPDAVIDGGPGVTAFIDLPNIEGDASGLLTLSFATPVLSVSYGFALSTSVPVNPGTVMEFFDTGGGLLGFFSAAAADFGFAFAEGGNVERVRRPSALLSSDSTTLTTPGLRSTT